MSTLHSNSKKPYVGKRVFEYVVSLQNTTARYIDIFSISLLSISSPLFLINASYLNPESPIIPRIVLAIAILIIVAYNVFRRWKHNVPTVYYRNALFLAAIGWATVSGYAWIFIPLAAMALLEKTAKQPLEIGFTDEEVVVNSLIRRRYEWQQFNNIILKDDLLTLDFTNNKLLQRLTIDEEGDASEDAFNEYCQKQLKKSRLNYST